MKKIIITISLCLIFIVISCKEDKIVEPILFTISGIVENENGEKISTEIFLISDDTLTAKSKTDGSFIFENLPAGEYKLLISISNNAYSYNNFDTLFSVSTDTFLKINIGKRIYSISGVVENDIGDKISTELYLISEDTLMTYSKTDGSFVFENLSEGEYKLVVNDTSFFDMDTLVLVSRNIYLELKVISKTKSDYFPLSVGNWWLYNFEYRPYTTSYIWKDGTVIWEIVSIDSHDTKIIYHVGQTVNARVIDFDNPFLTEPDTSYVVNEYSFFNLIQNTKGFITFTSDNYFNREVMINRYYYTNRTFLTLDYGPVESENVDTNLVSLDYEFHNITLELNIGIKTWIIRNSHNGGPRGELNLLDYEIK